MGLGHENRGEVKKNVIQRKEG